MIRTIATAAVALVVVSMTVACSSRAFLGNSTSGAASCLEYQAGANGEPLTTVAGSSALLTAPIWLIRHKLDLPLPIPLKAFVCPDEVAFGDKVDQIAGIGAYGTWRHPPTGVTTEAGLILRGDHLSQMTPMERAGIVSHELAHISQRALAPAGQRLSAPSWILEGHAEMVRIQVLDLAGYRTYAQSRDVIVGSFDVYRWSSDLRALEKHTDWWVDSLPRSEAMYGQAFLAVEWLVELYGTGKLMEFLKRPSLNADPREHWGKVFPIPYDYFIDEFNSRLKSLKRRHGVPSNSLNVDATLTSPHRWRESHGR
jgi:hypothetical protein